MGAKRKPCVLMFLEFKLLVMKGFDALCENVVLLQSVLFISMDTCFYAQNDEQVITTLDQTLNKYCFLLKFSAP